jgi:hypothetical protein
MSNTLSPRMPEAMDMILAILDYVTQEAKALALQKNTIMTKTKGS